MNSFVFLAKRGENAANQMLIILTTEDSRPGLRVQKVWRMQNDSQKSSGLSKMSLCPMPGLNFTNFYEKLLILPKL